MSHFHSICRQHRKYHIHQHIFYTEQKKASENITSISIFLYRAEESIRKYHLLSSSITTVLCSSLIVGTYYNGALFLEFKQLIIKIFYILNSDPCSNWEKNIQIWKAPLHNEFYFQQIKHKN